MFVPCVAPRSIRNGIMKKKSYCYLLLLCAMVLASCGQGKRLYGHLKKVNKRKSTQVEQLTAAPTVPISTLSITASNDSVTAIAPQREMVVPLHQPAPSNTTVSALTKHPVAVQRPSKKRCTAHAVGFQKTARKKSAQRYRPSRSAIFWAIFIFFLIVLIYMGFGVYFLVTGIVKNITWMWIVGGFMVATPFLIALILHIANT